VQDGGLQALAREVQRMQHLRGGGARRWAVSGSGLRIAGGGQGSSVWARCPAVPVQGLQIRGGLEGARPSLATQLMRCRRPAGLAPESPPQLPGPATAPTCGGDPTASAATARPPSSPPRPPAPAGTSSSAQAQPRTPTAIVIRRSGTLPGDGASVQRRTDLQRRRYSSRSGTSPSSSASREGEELRS
jgi:hypothetical protein